MADTFPDSSMDYLTCILPFARLPLNYDTFFLIEHGYRPTTHLVFYAVFLHICRYVHVDPSRDSELVFVYVNSTLGCIDKKKETKQCPWGTILGNKSKARAK